MQPNEEVILDAKVVEIHDGAWPYGGHPLTDWRIKGVNVRFNMVACYKEDEKLDSLYTMKVVIHNIGQNQLKHYNARGYCGGQNNNLPDFIQCWIEFKWFNNWHDVFQAVGKLCDGTAQVYLEHFRCTVCLKPGDEIFIMVGAGTMVL